MSLNSVPFIIFLATVVIAVRLLAQRGSPGAARALLLAASFGFYAAVGPEYVPVLAASIVFNWFVAQRIAATTDNARQRWLTLGIVVDVSALGFFKYATFVIRTVSGLVPGLTVPSWAFPLGISFFTLQQVMYLVDCAEELVPPSSLMDNALFVSFFPYVTAGPIARARSMVPQLQKLGTTPDISEDVAKGLAVFTIGLFKKSVVADGLGVLVDTGYADVSQLGHFGAWICSLSYAMQLYFDFSGYSDMAIGSARTLGIELPTNFEAPYRSISISEFWQRWHITLSKFITTYLYTPMIRRLGRATTAKSAVVTLIAMAIAGLWHGPSWNYVLFGVIHGLALGGLQFWKKRKAPRLPRVLAWAITMVVVDLGFVFFRCTTLADAVRVCELLIPGRSGSPDSLIGQLRAGGLIVYAPVWIAAPFIVAYERTSNHLLANFRPTRPLAGLVIGMLLLAMLFMNSNVGRGFVYAAF